MTQRRKYSMNDKLDAMFHCILRIQELCVVIIILLVLSFFVSCARADTYLFPVKEPIYIKNKILCTAWYSYRRADMGGKQYRALNLPSREGSEILACASGKVIDTGYQRYAGVYIKIKIDNTNIVYEVNHLSNWNVKKGEDVKRGDVIGYVGRSGRTTGAHLRIVFYKDGEKMFINATTWGLDPYKDFEYSAGSSRDELRFDFL